MGLTLTSGPKWEEDPFNYSNKEEPTVEQMNREVAEWLHCGEDVYWCCRCGKHVEKVFPMTCPFCRESLVKDRQYPDFSQGVGIIRLLEEMMKREDFKGMTGFCMRIGLISLSRDAFYLDPDYIITPVKLLQAVYEWSKEHPKEGIK